MRQVVAPLVLWGALIASACGGGGSGGGASAPPAVQVTAQSASGAVTFVNPLLDSGPDPFVTSKDGVYYYTHTSGDRVVLRATTAMSRLAQAKSVTVFVAPATGENSRDVWAPELHRLDGKWYVYYTAGDGSSTPTIRFPSQRTFVLENDAADPLQGTWVDRGRIRQPLEDHWAIDATVLEHAGERYLLWSGHAADAGGDQNLYISRMSDPWTLVGPRVLIAAPTLAWERAAEFGVIEAPQVIKGPDGRVFVVYSANGCWTDQYALGLVALAAGGDPLDPTAWEKRPEPIFTGSDAGGAVAPGHVGFFKSTDGKEDWIVYHANPRAGQGCGNARSPRMQPVTWGRDGAPSIGAPAAIDASLPVPSGEPRLD